MVKFLFNLSGPSGELETYINILVILAFLSARILFISWAACAMTDDFFCASVITDLDNGNNTYPLMIPTPVAGTSFTKVSVNKGIASGLFGREYIYVFHSFTPFVFNIAGVNATVLFPMIASISAISTPFCIPSR